MKTNRKEIIGRLQPLAALAVTIAGLSVMAACSHQLLGFWHDFLSVDSGLNVLRQISINLCLSLGMTLVIISGGIDLSVGSVLAFSGAIAAGLLKNGAAISWFGVHLQFTPLGAIVAGVLVGTALGWFNGVAVTRFRLPPFVATLGMLSIARGFTQLWTGGFPINDLGPTFAFIGSGFWLGVPTIVWICAALVGAFHVLARHTPLGRHIYAVGGSERAAAFAGLEVRRIKVRVYAIAGAMAGVAGVLLTARLDSATPTAGIGYELDSIAAVVIGGTSLSGGRGSIVGTVLGCLTIGVLNTGLVLLAISPFWQQVIKGFVILAAVALDKMRARTGE